MAVTATLSNHYKYALQKKLIDLDTDTIKVLLMRDGFTFNKDIHATKKNIKGTITGSSNISFTQSTKKITKATGGFTAAGFVAGNEITITGTTNNNVTVIISTASDTEIVVTTDSLTDESDQSATITTDDELATANGYTQDTKTTGEVTVEEDDTNDRSDATFPTVTWTAAGGDIGPTPGAILYDDTSTDDTIIGYLDFGTDQTATTGETFNIASGCFRNV